MLRLLLLLSAEAALSQTDPSEKGVFFVCTRSHNGAMRFAGRGLSVPTAAVLLGFVLGIAGCDQKQATTVTHEASKPDASVTAEATKPAEPVQVVPDEPVTMAALAQEFGLAFPELEKVEPVIQMGDVAK